MSMNNTDNSSKHELDIQHRSPTSQENPNEILDSVHSTNAISNTDNMTKSDMALPSATIFCFNMKSSHKAIFGAVLFAGIVMTIGILTVCLTSPKANRLCQSSFYPVIKGNSFQQNSNPRSLATGDFNHDKFLDIVVINPGTNNIGIFLNYGNGTFTPQMIFTTGDFSTPLAGAVGDYNNDTHLDIAITNYDTHNIGIFLGYGNGTFTSQTTFSTGTSRPVSIAVGDLNNDHWLDIAITNNGTNNIGILLGYGNGSFAYQITYSTGYDSLPYSVVIADFNNDHYLDIIVGNYGTDNIGVFLGVGNGTFTTQTIYSTSPRSNPYSVAVNDLNNDGQLDVAIANSGTNNVGIFFGDGNGSFVSQATYSISPGSSPHSIIIADFNQDNQLDIAVSNYDTNNISILNGYGNGSFAAPTMHSTGLASAPFGMISGDFDNDNQSDIAVANSETNNVFVLIGYTIMQSETPTTYPTGDGSLPYQIAVGDCNNDTQLDLMVANYGTNNVGVLLGYGNGSFREQRKYSTGKNSFPASLAVIDLDGDDRLDIVVGNSNSESVGILYGYGNGSFAPVVIYFTGDLSSAQWIIVNDFNNDNHVDIAFADYGTNSIGIFLGYGNRTFGSLTTYSSGVSSLPISIAAGDLNNDYWLDMAVACYGTGNIVIFLGSGDGTFTLFTIYSTGDSSRPCMLTITDLNQDNRLDIIVVNVGTSNVGIFFGFGNGTFGTQLIYSTGLHSSPGWVSVADMNNDSFLDLVVANSNIGNVGVFLGAHQRFGNQTTYSTGDNSAPYSIDVGDFNKDNRLDIAVANYGTNNVAILLGHPNEGSASQKTDAADTDSQLSSITIDNFNHKNHLDSTMTNWITSDVPILLGDYYATFLNQTTYSTGASAYPYSIAIADLNEDTHMDLVVANSGNENIGIFFGLGDGIFATEIIYPTGVGSNPQNVLIDDFNNDNQLDVAVTNPREDIIIVFLGNDNGTFSTEMTYSTGSGSNPDSLAIGNFNDDNYLDLVVANAGTDTIGIFFGFDYTSFARQNPCESGESSGPTSIAIADFNNDGQLDIVSALYGSNNLGVFLGYSNGTFSPMITYADVPSSHPWSVVVGDFNNDNQPDLTIAYWSVDCIGVVFGYGNGSFAQPILYSTGFGTRPVSVAVGDFNNDTFLDITTANYGGNSIAVLFGYKDGSFGNMTTLSSGKGSSPSSVNTFDVNNDTHLDIVVANQGTNNVGVFLGYGNGSFAKQLTSSTGAASSPWCAIAGDFNKDGRLDLAVTNYGTGNVGVLYGYGNGIFGNLQIYTTGIGSNPTWLNVGDFNNDNELDIIVTDNTSGNAGIFFGFSDGTFADMSIIPIGQDSFSYSVAVADFNNDSHLDFAFADFNNNNIGVFLSNGSEPFGGQTTFFLDEGSRPYSVAVGDFNNDSQLDIAIANYGTNNIGIRLGYGNRMFSNIITYSVGENSHPMSLAIGDFNNDSLTDMIVANSNTNNIVVLTGDGNGSFSDLLTYSMGESSQPVSVAVGYFNRDDQMDIAVANFGTNNVCILFGSGNGTFPNQTWYSMSYGSRPNWVVFKDVNNDGWEDIAVVTSGTDNIEILLNLC